MESVDKLREWMKDPRFLITKKTEEDLLNMFDAIEEEFKEQEQAHKFAYSQVYEFANNLKGQLLDFDKMDEQQDAMAEHGWVKLPVDADGEVIHVGDDIDRGDAHGHVIALMLSNYPKKWGGDLHWSIQLEGEQAPTALDLTFHHHHETVEDILRGVVTLCYNTWKKESAFHFCDVEDMMDSGNIAEYAAKLRLAGDE